MLVKSEIFLGIDNVNLARRVPKVQFTPDGNVMLSGDATTIQNMRPKIDGSLETRNGRTKLTGANITDGRILWVSQQGDLTLVQDGSTLYLLNGDASLTSLGSVGSRNPCRFAEHMGKERFIFIGNKTVMKKYVPERTGTPASDFLDWHVRNDWFRTDTPFETTDLENDTVGGNLQVLGNHSNDISYWGPPQEFNYPRREYRGPVLTDTFVSFYGCMYLAEGRFLLESEPTQPELFRRVNNIPQQEEITAISIEPGFMYVHTYNSTKVYSGNHSSDWLGTGERLLPIGAIKQNIIHPMDNDVPGAVFMTPKGGWAIASQGTVKYIDHEHFRLDLPVNARAINTYDILNKEVSCNIQQ